MRRFPRSLGLYIAASTVYAAIIFLAVHAIYGVELGRAGVRMPDAGALIGSIEITSFIVWLGISLIAGTILHRLATALEGARDESAVRDAEIGSIFALSQALSGSLDLAEIAREYLRSARRALDPSTTLGLLVHDDVAEAFRLVAEEGPHAGGLLEKVYSVSELPTAIRTRVFDHRQSLVLPDVTGGGEQWRLLARDLPDAQWIHSFAALPLVSQERLVGAVIGGAEKGGTLTADRLQLVLVLGQFVAGAIRTSLSLAEAQARADREELVSRIARRARASLDPDEVLRGTVEELGQALRVDRVVAATGTTPDTLRVTYEWNAPGVTPQGKELRALPVSRLAAETGRTAVVRDVLADARLAQSVERKGSVRSIVATPILVAGELAGTLSLNQASAPRDWTTDEVRLVEAVARELRVAIETARLFQARKGENERLIALQRAAATLGARTDPKEVFDMILRSVVQLLGEGSASLYIWDEEAGLLRLAENVNIAGDVPGNRALRPGDGIVGRVFVTREPLIVNDYQSWEGRTAVGEAKGLRASLAVPLVRSGHALGVLSIRSYDPEASYTDDDARLLSLFGDQAAAALATVDAFGRQRQAVEQLERLNRAKSEFVSIVSHEFRTPLTGIQGFSEMMRDEQLSLEEMREYAGDINKDAQRLNRMINEMLDLGRMESGRMTMHMERMDLNAVVEDVADRVRPNAPNHTLTLDLQDLPLITADRDRMTQVASNLLNNAVKYSPTGGRITVMTRAEGNEVRLDVRDEGLGIPADALETIFERYSRVDSQATKDIQGTGLGLPIVRQIVHLHGGRVWAESELGRGSVFHVVLPLAGSGAQVEA